MIHRHNALKSLAATLVLVALACPISPAHAQSLATGPSSGGGGNFSASDLKEAGMKTLNMLAANGVKEVRGIFLASLKSTCEKAQVRKAKGPLRDRGGHPADLTNHPEAGLIEYNESALAVANLRQKAKLMIHECLGLMGIDESSYSISLAMIKQSEIIASKNVSSIAVPDPDPTDDTRAEEWIASGIYDFAWSSCYRATSCFLPSLESTREMRDRLTKIKGVREVLVKRVKEANKIAIGHFASLIEDFRRQMPHPIPLSNYDTALRESVGRQEVAERAFIGRMDQAVSLIDRLETLITETGTQGDFQILSKEAGPFVDVFNRLRVTLDDFYMGQFAGGALSQDRLPPELIKAEHAIKLALGRDLNRVVDYGPSCAENIASAIRDMKSRGREASEISFFTDRQVTSNILWRIDNPKNKVMMKEWSADRIFAGFPRGPQIPFYNWFDSSFILPFDTNFLNQVLFGTAKVKRPLKVECVPGYDWERRKHNYDPETHTWTTYANDSTLVSKIRTALSPSGTP
jgi:hypothetical protein